MRKVNYAHLLANSAIRPEVEALYARAGLSLTDDLATLARHPGSRPTRPRWRT